MKPNSHNPGPAIRPQKQWTVNLSGEKATRLTMPFPRLEKLERLAQIEDQFRMTIGDHSLGRSAFAIVLHSGAAARRRSLPSVPFGIGAPVAASGAW